MNPKLFGWEFYVYHTTDVVPQISVEEIQPFDLYAHDIKKTFFKNEKMQCGYYSGKIAVYYGELKKLPAENKRVYIFVVPHEIRSKGGQLKKKDN
jgi:aerobic-type carbon monoxide dehydrogenase small subunit (CoxS/CutS family)